MKMLAVLVAVAACAWGQTGTRTKSIGEEDVLPGPSFAASELVTISGMKFYACKLSRNNADCTVAIGYATCHLPHQDYVVTLTFTLYDTYSNAVYKGDLVVKLDRPKPCVPVKFEAIGPGWHSEQARGEDRRNVKAQYSMSVDVKGYKPPKFQPKRDD